MLFRTITGLVIALAVGVVCLRWRNREPGTATSPGVSPVVPAPAAQVAETNPAPAAAAALARLRLTNQAPATAQSRTRVIRIAPETAAYASGTNPPLIESTSVLPEEFEPEPALAALRQDYKGTNDFDARMDLIDRLRGFPPPAAFPVATQLFQEESDPELKETLLETAMDLEGLGDAKLDFLGTLLPATPNAPVRVTLIDALVDLADRRAIPMIEPFANDADDEVRAAAVGGLEILRSIPEK